MSPHGSLTGKDTVDFLNSFLTANDTASTRNYPPFTTMLDNGNAKLVAPSISAEQAVSPLGRFFIQQNSRLSGSAGISIISSGNMARIIITSWRGRLMTPSGISIFMTGKTTFSHTPHIELSPLLDQPI